MLSLQCDELDPFAISEDPSTGQLFLGFFNEDDSNIEQKKVYWVYFAVLFSVLRRPSFL